MGATASINSTVSAGLPNITAYLKSIEGRGFVTNPSGAFYGGSWTGWDMGADDLAGAYGELSFDASRSCSIYGSSSTVQPPAVNCTVLIRHD